MEIDLQDSTDGRLMTQERAVSRRFSHLSLNAFFLHPGFGWERTSIALGKLPVADIGSCHYLFSPSLDS
jgi:hypothetical protein